MEWTPQEDILDKIMKFLKESQSVDSGNLANLQEKLEEFNKWADFNNYLIFVLTKSISEDLETRSLSGLILKNNLTNQYDHLLPSTIEFIKKECMEGLCDPSHLIRSTIGIVISTILYKSGLCLWPSLLQSLCDRIDSPDYDICERSFDVLHKIIEKSYGIFDADDIKKHLDVLIPKFLHAFNHTSSKIRVYSIQCVNLLLVQRSRAVLKHIDHILNNLFQVAHDEEPLVRKEVCRSFLRVLEVKVDSLASKINDVIEYILQQIQDSNEDVALMACEFWQSLAGQSIYRNVLMNHLSSLIPILIRGMEYSDKDIILLKENNDDNEPLLDKLEDITCEMHSLKFGSVPENSLNKELNNLNNVSEQRSLDDWNLRKCSAASLDCLAYEFKNDLLPIVIPILKETLFSEDWMMKESAILALGAIAEGCITGLSGVLPEVVPYMIKCLCDERAPVRATTCWTLSRYTQWIFSQPHDIYLKPIITELSKCILDENKIVKEAAYLALANYAEESYT